MAAPAPVVVVGLGLNVTEAPDPVATSLAMLGATVDRTDLTEAVLRHLAARIDAWRSRPGRRRGAGRRLPCSRSVTIGNRVRASLPGDRTVEGVATDVDDLGRLRIDTGEEVLTVSAGDITHLRAGRRHRVSHRGLPG